MVDAIATSLAGLQRASVQADKATAALASFGTDAAGTQDIVTLSANALTSQNSLEASVIGLKIAAQSYKANAQALNSILETQKKAFDQLI